MIHHLFHSVRYPSGRPTIVCEITVIKELERAGIIVPKIVSGEAVRVGGEWHALLVIEDMMGLTNVVDWYARHAVSLYSSEVRQAMLKAVALASREMRSVNRQHGCCYVRHIYVKTEGRAEAGFPDLEKSRHRLCRDKVINRNPRQLERYLEPTPKVGWEQVEAYYYAM